MHWRGDGVRYMDASEVEIFTWVGGRMVEGAVIGNGFCFRSRIIGRKLVFAKLREDGLIRRSCA